MEALPGYDVWKLACPEYDFVRCVDCGYALTEDDNLDVKRELCNQCYLKENNLTLCNHCCEQTEINLIVCSKCKNYRG